ncbi:MAG: phosphoketolase family protein [Candidatus Paceibacteria bacterium]
MSDTEAIKKYVRAANFLSAAQIYLQDNFIGEKNLASRDIKPRLMGHWGTCPGINFVYAHLNYLIKKHNTDMMFVLGPGHGFPALQSNLFLEGTLEKYYPKASHSEDGIGYICKNFSWPYGFPSHSSPATPGVILEGGELGYALSTSNGAVLPILHLNGYKISGPTIFGRMSDDELKSLFTGFGYEPFIVDESNGSDSYEKMAETLEKSHSRIIDIQKKAKNGELNGNPKFPMIILRTPKGWTGIKEFNGEKIEGNALSHQVPASNAKEKIEDLKALEGWLKSYKFEELFDKEKGFDEDMLSILPKKDLRMGASKHALGGEGAYTDLLLPKVSGFTETDIKCGGACSSSMKKIGMYLKEVFALNKEKRNFRLMSPDETYSNKLDDVFEETSRAFVWPKEEWDKDIAADGRVIEMLSEHSLQGLMQGYVLTGRHSVFASYEAFVQIVSSMADQYAKFLKIARETKWRGDISSLNYILTSSWWRQEHNGFSHQNPGFIDNMLQKQGCFVNVYFPPDANSAILVMERCLESKKEINIIVAGKKAKFNWLTPEQAEYELKQGLMIWEFASDEDPDVVVASAGDYLTIESLAAIDIVKDEAPEIKTRFVNILSLSAIGLGDADCKTPFNDFDEYFTEDKPVIFNFHGYPETLKQTLFNYGKHRRRFYVHGYIENGSTTTPFDMQIRNTTSRYHLAMDIFNRAAEQEVIDDNKRKALVKKYEAKIYEHLAYIKENGTDLPEITNWKWKRNI